MTVEVNPRNQRTKRKKKKNDWKKNIGLVMAGLMVYCLGIFTYLYFLMDHSIYDMKQEALALVENVTEETFKQNNTSIFYTSEGEILSKAKSEKDILYLEYEQIPKSVVDAIVLVEDKRFYDHNGVDYVSLVGIGVEFLTNGFDVPRGGSTITQQLARNMFLSHERSLERKYKEMIIAKELDQKFTKEQILEFYLNNIYFGNGIYGIENAAVSYFDESIDSLSLNEQVFLLGLPSNPNLYNPYKNMDNAVYRKNVMLDVLGKAEYITAEELAQLKEEEIVLKPKKIEFQNYLQSYAQHGATEILMMKNGFEFKNKFASNEERKVYEEIYEEAYKVATDDLRTGGYRIETSLNVALQEKIQEILDKELKHFTATGKDGVYDLQGAAAVIDNATGRVVALVGGRSQEGNYLSLNRAFQSYRQPGSTVKPLVVYGPILDQPNYGPRSLIGDLPDPDGPRNYNNQYSGIVTMERAVTSSKNIPAWNVMEELGTKKAIQYLYNLNFQKIMKQDESSMALSLGGMTYGSNPVEMAAAYSTFSRDGKFIAPSAINRIKTADGKVIYENQSDETVVYTVKSSRQMTAILEKTMRYGTGAKVSLKNRPSAGKTGTTNDAKDGWFVGYTPQYTMAVWVGCDTPKAVNGLQGSSYPGRIWKQSMEYLHQGLPVTEFKDYLPKKGERNDNINVVFIPKPEESEENLDGGTGENTPDGGNNTQTTPTDKPANPLEGLGQVIEGIISGQ